MGQTTEAKRTEREFILPDGWQAPLFAAYARSSVRLERDRQGNGLIGRFFMSLWWRVLRASEYVR